MHKYTLSVRLKAAQSISCTVNYSHTDQTHRPHLLGNQFRAVARSPLFAHCDGHPTQGGEVVRLQRLARWGELSSHRPLSDAWTDPQASLQIQQHVGPQKQPSHGQQWRQSLRRSSNTAGFTLWQHRNECLSCYSTIPVCLFESNKTWLFFFIKKLHRLSHWNEEHRLAVIQMLNNHGSYVDSVVPRSAANSYQFKVTVAELHRQLEDNLRVTKSLFCISPQGRDLRANLGLSPLIPSLPLLGEPANGTVEQSHHAAEVLSAHSADIHLPDHTERKNNADFILLRAHSCRHARTHTKQSAHIWQEENVE